MTPISRVITAICEACHRAYNATVFYNKPGAISCPFCGKVHDGKL